MKAVKFILFVLGLIFIAQGIFSKGGIKVNTGDGTEIQLGKLKNLAWFMTGIIFLGLGGVAAVADANS